MVIAITLSAFIALPLMAYLLTTALLVTFLELARAVWPSVAAGIVMAAGLLLSTRHLFDARVAQLAVDVATGAVLYISALLCLWWLRGRPAGVERAVMTLLASRFRKSTSA